MNDVRMIEVKEDILADNTRIAEGVRLRLRDTKTLLLNLMSSPGSGKTSLILRTIEGLQGAVKLGVIEADIDSKVDAEKVAAAGIPAVQLRTGGFCHLDATMVTQGIDALPAQRLDLIIIENVGNLVCPAEFDTGAHKNVMILSVPEGDDKPLKYPLIFQRCGAMIVNKTDVLPYFDFDLDKVTEFARQRNPGMQIFPISAKTGEGVEALAAWICAQICKEKEKKETRL